MKHLLRFTTLALTILGGPLLHASEPKPVPPLTGGSSTSTSTLAGQYSGRWKASNDVIGDLRIQLKKGDAATWVAEVSFTYEGVNVSTNMKAVHVEEAKLRLEFSWVVQGAPGLSKIDGELKGATLHGTFESTGGEGDSTGTWTATRI